MTLIVLRHGQSKDNASNKFTGWNDTALTNEGKTQAINAGKLIAKSVGVDIDVIYTSDLIRASDTALFLSLQTGNDPIIKDSRLRERNYGLLAGLDKDLAKQYYGADVIEAIRRSWDAAPQDGESLKQVKEERTDPFVIDTLQPALDAGKTVVIVAHHNSIRALLVSLGVYDETTIEAVTIPNATPIVVDLVNKVTKAII